MILQRGARFTAAAALWLIASWPLNAVELVEEVNTGHGRVTASHPAGFYAFDDDLTFFRATDRLNGRELWRTDGTPAGTKQVKDIMPGPGSSNPGRFIRLGDRLLFSAEDPSRGTELWRSDGTAEGTVLVKDINPGRSSGQPNGFVLLDGDVYFSASTADHGAEIWKTDGTTEGTVLVVDLARGPSGSNPSGLAVVKDYLIFAAGTESTGRELWTLKAGSERPELVQDIYAGASSAIPGLVRGAVLENRYIFQAYDGATSAVWVTVPGDPARTVRLDDVVSDSTPTCCAKYLAHEGWVYFNPFGESELWRTDGRVSELIADVNGVYPLLGWEDRVLLGTDTQDFGREFWVSNGTEAGTQLLRDINPGPANSIPINPIVIQGVLYFHAEDAGGERELWKSDGTTTGTVPVANINGPLSGMVPNRTATGAVGDSLLFAATETDTGNELWTSDGTPQGTHLLVNVSPDQDDAQVASLATVNDKVVFAAYREDLGIELWSSDGAGVELLADVLPGPDSGLAQTHLNGLPIIQASDTLFFFVNTTDEIRGGVRVNLWRTDGTSEGTRRAVTLSSKEAGDFSMNYGRRRPIVELDGVIYFMAAGDPGAGLYRLDPAVDSAEFVVDTPYELTDSFGPKLVASNDALYYAGEADTGFDALWTSDGTEAGTAVVKEFGDSANIGWMVASDDLVFFIVDSSVWRSDGTSGGTFPLQDFASSGTFPYFLTVHDQQLFFVGTDPIHGAELWVSDGSVAGTRLVRDINPGPAGSTPRGLTSAGTGLYFAALTADDGIELWRSDGSEAGTYQVADIAAGVESGLPFGGVMARLPDYAVFDPSAARPLLPSVEILPLDDGQVLFRGWSRDSGTELWASDGTRSGTRRLSDIAPGDLNGNPGYMVQLENTVFFSADDGLLGRELYRTEAPASTVLFASGFE